MKLTLLVFLFLFGCNEKVEPPKQFKEEIRKAKNVNCVQRKKIISVPCEWKEKINISFSDSTSVIEIIKKITQEKKLNLRLDANLKDFKTFFSCKNTSVLEVIKKLCEAANFRIQINNNDIYITEDVEYDHIHEITFLSNIRTSNTNTSINPSSNHAGLSVGSSISLNNSHTSDLWKEIEQNLEFILKDTSQTFHKNEKHSTKKRSNYTLNKQAGILIVHGTQQHQKRVHEFLLQVHKRAASQVLIEAKVLSVRLNHEFKTGINWNSLNMYNNAKNWVNSTNDVKMAVSSEAQNNNALKMIVSNDKSENEIISLLEQYGEVFTVSNPTTTVLNNQYAVFKVAENKIYFKLRQSDLITVKGKNITDQDAVRTFSSDVQTVPVGTILSVQPSVDFRNRTVTLFIHPTISDVVDIIEDPAVTLMSSGKHKSSIPIISTQEMDSTIRVDDGSLVIVGGLIKKSNKTNKKGIPGVRQVPLLGQTHKEMIHEEVVIMLRAYILDAPNNNLVSSLKDYELFTLNK